MSHWSPFRDLFVFYKVTDSKSIMFSLNYLYIVYASLIDTCIAYFTFTSFSWCILVKHVCRLLLFTAVIYPYFHLCFYPCKVLPNSASVIKFTEIDLWDLTTGENPDQVATSHSPIGTFTFKSVLDATLDYVLSVTVCIRLQLERN